MKIVVNDTNIFFDLIDVNLLDHLFQLNVEVHTTDLIINEIQQEQQIIKVSKLIQEKKLRVASHDEIEMALIIEKTMEHPQLSIQDCSVWHYSEQNDYALLSGDGALRKAASKSGVEVKGLLWVFDEFIRESIITSKIAAEKLEFLLLKGCRLPKKECQERLERWKRP